MSEVNHPERYNRGSIECIDALKESMTHEQFIGFLKGNVVKYLWRLGLKDDSVQEVDKALWYLNQLKQEISLDNGDNECYHDDVVDTTELDCLDCAWFEASCEADRDDSETITSDIPCKTCKNNFIPGSKEWKSAKSNWKEYVEYTGCNACVNNTKGEDEFPCNLCKHAAVQGTAEYDERKEMFCAKE